MEPYLAEIQAFRNGKQPGLSVNAQQLALALYGSREAFCGLDAFDHLSSIRAMLDNDALAVVRRAQLQQVLDAAPEDLLGLISLLHGMFPRAKQLETILAEARVDAIIPAFLLALTADLMADAPAQPAHAQPPPHSE